MPYTFPAAVKSEIMQALGRVGPHGPDHLDSHAGCTCSEPCCMTSEGRCRCPECCCAPAGHCRGDDGCAMCRPQWAETTRIVTPGTGTWQR